MPKKVSIVSAISLILLIALIAVLVKLRPRSDKRLLSIVPAQVSVLDPEENTILLLSCDEFLTGCVRGLLPRGESPAPDALRAVTAVQRTRILRRIQTRESGALSPDSLGADFVIGEDFPYVGDNGDTALNDKLREAVQAAEILTIDDELFDAPLCRISTGRTDEAPHSPSVSLLCDIDAKSYTSRLAFSREEVWQTLKPAAAPSDCSEWFQNPVFEETGSLRSIEFCGREISGEKLMRCFDLPSRAISVEFSEDLFFFICKGRGSNQGMSVNSAIFLSKSGYTAEEILSLFYPEANLNPLS